MPGQVIPAVQSNATANRLDDLVVLQVDTEDLGIYRALAGGVTTIRQLHGSANTIGGRDSVIKLKWGRRVDEALRRRARNARRARRTRALRPSHGRAQGGQPARHLRNGVRQQHGRQPPGPGDGGATSTQGSHQL